MMLHCLLLLLLGLASLAICFQDWPSSGAIDGDDDETLAQKWGFDYSFSGISTFAHLPHHVCLVDRSITFDIGVIGAPFDTAVSYRPGARFGPRAIRAASARMVPFRAFNHRALINPFTGPFKIVDCGDIPVVPFDNAVALRQMTEAYEILGQRTPARDENWWRHPKILSLGGDHSIALAALRGLNRAHGQPIALLHFDAHLDTWLPSKYPAAWPSEQSAFTHGNMFWLASQEGLIHNGSSVHAGLRTRLADIGDYADDDEQGFLRLHADDIDDMGGPSGIVKAIVDRIGTERPVYLSLDIDVLDPGLCPGTGTPEPGGWTSREVIRILRGLADLNVVGADIVEVAPAYDGAGEQTSLVAAQVAYEIITSWVLKGMKNMPAVHQTSSSGNQPKDEL